MAPANNYHLTTTTLSTITTTNANTNTLNTSIAVTFTKIAAIQQLTTHSTSYNIYVNCQHVLKGDVVIIITKPTLSM